MYMYIFDSSHTHTPSSSILPAVQVRHSRLGYDGLVNLVVLWGPLLPHQFLSTTTLLVTYLAAHSSSGREFRLPEQSAPSLFQLREEVATRVH
jgi:hypothetical protein